MFAIILYENLIDKIQNIMVQKKKIIDKFQTVRPLKDSTNMPLKKNHNENSAKETIILKSGRKANRLNLSNSQSVNNKLVADDNKTNKKNENKSPKTNRKKKLNISNSKNICLVREKTTALSKTSYKNNNKSSNQNVSLEGLRKDMLGASKSKSKNKKINVKDQGQPSILKDQNCCKNNKQLVISIEKLDDSLLNTLKLKSNRGKPDVEPCESKLLLQDTAGKTRLQLKEYNQKLVDLKNIIKTDKEQNKTITDKNSTQHLPVYKQDDLDSSSDESIRPSQVYEFDFSPRKEILIKKESKKEAKKIKTIIKQKAIKKQENIKISEENKTNLEKSKNDKSKKVIGTISEITPIQKQNNLTSHILNGNELDNNATSMKVRENENCSSNVLKNNQSNRISIQSTDNFLLDEIIISPSNRENLYKKHKSSTPVTTTSFIKSPKIISGVNSFENNKNNSHQVFDNHLNDNEMSVDDNHLNENDEISKICEDFEEILENTNTSSVIATNLPQQQPWRLANIFSRTPRRRIFDVKNSSLPSYNQDITIKPDDFSFLSDISQPLPSTEALNNTKPKSVRQSSILSYVNQAKEINFINETSGSLFDSNINSPPPVSNKTPVNTSESSISDISNIDPVDTPSKNVDNMKKRTKIDFKTTVSSSPLQERLSRQNFYSNKKKSSRKVINISDKENVPDLENFHKSIKPNKIQKVFHSPNIENKNRSRLNDTSMKFIKKWSVFKDISNQENISNSSPPKNSIDTCFGFDLSDSEEINRNSKKPVRITVSEIVKNARKKDNIEIVPELVTEPSRDIVIEPESEMEPLVYNEDDSDVEENVQDSDIDNNDAQKYLLFDEPRYTQFEERRLTNTYECKKRKRLNSAEGEVKAKKKKVQKNKREDEEFEKWAEQFNSMCEDVDKEELWVE